MSQEFITRQFRAGNSEAVRLRPEIAFPPKTELVVSREGETIIVKPLEKTMEHVPKMFASMKKKLVNKKLIRPEFIDAKRNWKNS
jgi:antitoxin VapB